MKRNILDRYGQLQRGDAPKQRVKDDLQLGAGQLLTDALVSAVAERDVLTGARAMKVQPLGFGKCVGIPVRRRQVDDDPFAGADDLAGDFNVLGGDAALPVLDDGQVAQQFLDRVGDDFRVVGVTQHGRLFRVLQQRQHAEADHVGSGFVPGDQQPGTQLRGLLDAELAGFDAFGQVRHRVFEPGFSIFASTSCARYLCRLIAPLTVSSPVA